MYVSEYSQEISQTYKHTYKHTLMHVSLKGITILLQIHQHIRNNLTIYVREVSNATDYRLTYILFDLLVNSFFFCFCLFDDKNSERTRDTLVFGVQNAEEEVEEKRALNTSVCFSCCCCGSVFGCDMKMIMMKMMIILIMLTTTATTSQSLCE